MCDPRLQLIINTNPVRGPSAKPADSCLGWSIRSWASRKGYRNSSHDSLFYSRDPRHKPNQLHHQQSRKHTRPEYFGVLGRAAPGRHQQSDRQSKQRQKTENTCSQKYFDVEVVRA